MSMTKELETWIEEVSSGMSNLSKKQAIVLAMYSYGMIMTGRCGLNIIVGFLSLLTDESVVNLRQRLREWLYEKKQKKGEKRCEVEVKKCFEMLIRWILKYWKDNQIILAADATNLSDRFIILTVSVLTSSCAIPVACHVRLSKTKGEWNPIWFDLLDSVSSAIPSTYTVYVLTDRGLASPKLFGKIKKLSWHPMMRISADGLYRVQEGSQWKPLKKIAYRGMTPKVLRIWCYKRNTILCTLLVSWDATCKEPMLVITDRCPQQVRSNFYSLRMWIECGFKDLKRGGLRWEHSKIVHPHRMERLLLVMSISIFAFVRQGNLIHTLPPFFHKTLRLSYSTYGWLFTLVSALRHSPTPTPSFSLYNLPPFPT